VAPNLIKAFRKQVNYSNYLHCTQCKSFGDFCFNHELMGQTGTRFLIILDLTSHFWEFTYYVWCYDFCRNRIWIHQPFM